MAFYRLQPRVPKASNQNANVHWVCTDHQDLDYEILRLELMYDAEIVVNTVKESEFGGWRTRNGYLGSCKLLQKTV